MKPSRMTKNPLTGSIRRFLNQYSMLCLVFMEMSMTFSSCKTVETKPEVVTVVQTKYVYPSDSLLTPCPEQKPFTIQTNGELLMSLIELSTDYAVCSARMQSVITYVNSVKTGAGYDEILQDQPTVTEK